MTENVNKAVDVGVSSETDQRLNRRIFRVMLGTTVVATTVSLFVAPWRVTTGLLLGGLLALFSHRWLKNSAAAAISLSIGSTKPQLRITQFVIRYLVIGAVVFAAYEMGLVSLPATVFGLVTFVVALFGEALREFYFAIIRREETN